jgi:tripartite-type tricarboxylate transporter receptor subunit TctC
MNPRRREFLRRIASSLAVSLAPRFAFAQAYPSHAVRIIVPFAAGGPTDVCARLIAGHLSERLSKQFYVENVPGAGGNVGVGQAARTASDGYTILFTVSSYIINPLLYNKVPYDALRSFDPVTLLASFASGLSVNPSLPAATVKDLVALIQTNPAKYSYASPGTGTVAHLLGEQFRTALNLDLVHVPFGGGGPAIASVVAGHTPIAFAAMSATAPQVKDGRLRALAVMSQRRSESLPDVPTIGQAGYPDLGGEDWVGVMVPTGTPPEIAALLQQEIAGVVARPEVTERLTSLGFDPVASKPTEFATEIRLGTERWRKVIQAANIKLE